jgi:superfamily II DNA or RNA helicase
LKDECGHGAYERGKSYHLQGRTVLDLVEEQGEFLHLRATTRGSGRNRYQQEVYIGNFRGGLDIEGDCSCPVGFNCKHVVAACLAYREREPAPEAQASGASAFSQWLGGLSGAAPGQTMEIGWSKEYLLYHLALANNGGGIRIDFGVARVRQDGTFGKERNLHFSSLYSSTRYSTPGYFREVDDEAVGLLHACNRNAWSGATTVSGATGRAALDLIVRSGRGFWGRQHEQPLQPGPELLAQPGWREEGNTLRLGVDLPEGTLIAPVSPPLYIDTLAMRVGDLALPGGLAPDLLGALMNAPPIPRREAAQVSRLLVLHHPGLPTPTEVAIRELGAAPTPRLALSGDFPHHVSVLLDFLYEEIAVAANQEEPVLTLERDAELVRIRRDLQAEAAAAARLKAAGLEPGAGTSQRFTAAHESADSQAALARWFDFIEQTLPQLESEGWRVEWSRGEAPLLSHAAAIDAELESSDNDWFGLRFDIEVNGVRMPLLPLVSELIGDYRPGTLPPRLYLADGAGNFIAIDSARVEPILQTIVDLYDSDSGDAGLRLSRLDAPRLLDLGDIKVRGGNELQQLAKRLRDFDGIKAAKIPTTFKGELRAYQQQGVNWLQFLRDYGLAGILADDMGLGKTVQTLAHLAVEKRAGRMRQPSLIIAPTSLMGNWRREAAQFTPGLKVLVLHGPNRAEHFDTLPHYDLVLTTYPLLPRDADVLLEQPWHCLILDEAQQIKNPKSQAAQLVRELRANHRLCLTGTPMENHLGELWAQFDFLLPGFLGTQEQFGRAYRNPIEREGDGDRLRSLTRRTAPFMLRRTKALVAGELPQKTELLRTIPIDGKQATLYESIRLTMERKVRQAIARKGLARSHITILDALLKLRQVCCDPRLLPAGTRGVKSAESAKLAMLMEMLPELLDEGRRILLFSQFTTMLGLIEEEIKAAGIPYAKLTGQTRKREAAIERFRSGEADLFLISLKAGGVGLNLTEADTVIHYDPWWNPAVEAQATDRAHRIGQDKPVFVYKLITEGTVEEKILALQARKKQLADNVYGKGKGETDLPIDAETIGALLAGE